MVKGYRKVTIKGFQDYEICQSGSIYSLHQQISDIGFLGQLSTRIDRGGYVSVRLSANGKTYTRLLHRILAESFVTNPLGLPEVNHKDGCKTCNHLENLEWVSHSCNTKHAYSMGLIKRRTKPVIDTATGVVYEDIRTAASMNSLQYTTLKNYLNGQRTNPTSLQYHTIQ